ncbi:MAG TPA: tetratricopeptide repeat-containing protein [Steroidobacteraceae bacterium]|nr:tetratricopeptide repeat-containing protein [Steroidobacteraceae bacterium]
MAPGTCFVVMGFGKKTDFETGRVLDLDKSYRNIIKPAVESAGYACQRADEIVHSGLIDVPMYERILNADIVIADVSTSNRNAYYELGVRHALRPYTTIVICENGEKTPFDINHLLIRWYRHLGEDIGYDEAQRCQAAIREAITTIAARSAEERVDSPVYQYVQNLVAPNVAAASATGAVAAAGVAEATAAAYAVRPSHSEMIEQVDAAQRAGNWLGAKAILQGLIALKQLATSPGETLTDPHLLQRLAFVTYKSKSPGEIDALREARAILSQLTPATSNDTETLGMWGSVNKRLAELTKEASFLDESIRGYGRGFYLRNDYYNGINLAFVLNMRAAACTARDDAIADFVQARRVRDEVAAICRQWLQDKPRNEPADPNDPAVTQDLNTRYWVLATLGEALIGLGDDQSGAAQLERAFALAPQPWMRGTTEEQIRSLRALLARSPLTNTRLDG